MGHTQVKFLAAQNLSGLQKSFNAWSEECEPEVIDVQVINQDIRSDLAQALIMLVLYRKTEQDEEKGSRSGAVEAAAEVTKAIKAKKATK